MKTIYTQSGLIRYAVTTSKLETNSNYDTAMHIKIVGERFPAYGTIIKSTDNVRKIATELINSWANKKN